jgi:hypothetical protein
MITLDRCNNCERAEVKLMKTRLILQTLVNTIENGDTDRPYGRRAISDARSVLWGEESE